jgi:hypothetical protein
MPLGQAEERPATAGHARSRWPLTQPDRDGNDAKRLSYTAASCTAIPLRGQCAYGMNLPFYYAIPIRSRQRWGHSAQARSGVPLSSLPLRQTNAGE